MTVLRRYQRLYDRIRQSNKDAEIGFSSILPRFPNKWKGKTPSKGELSYLKELNDQSFIINWRISEVCAVTPKLTFVDDMVGCENRKCGRWYHLRCVGVSKGQKCSWVCEKCTKEHSFSVQ